MTPNVSHGVDHIMVRVKDAPPWMDLFAGTFGLPISWPLKQADFATYGWVTVGNANLEFWAAADNNDLPAHLSLPLFHGFALEPSDIHSSVAILGERGIRTKSPRPFITQTNDGRRVINFTNSVILDLSTDTCSIFLCEWGQEGTIFPWAEKLTTTERKRKEQELLTACHGGPLGVTGLDQIRMTTPDLVGYTAMWQKALGQASPIALAEGITLSLTPGDDLRIDSIVLSVRSLEVARNFLTENKLLGTDAGHEISLSPSELKSNLVDAGRKHSFFRRRVSVVPVDRLAPVFRL